MDWIVALHRDTIVSLNFIFLDGISTAQKEGTK